MALQQGETELDLRSWLETERWKDITAASMAGRAFRMTTCRPDLTCFFIHGLMGWLGVAHLFYEFGRP